MLGAISSPAASISAPPGLSSSPVATDTPGSSSSSRSGMSQPGSTRPSKLTKATSRARAASAPRLQPAQKPTFSSKRSARAAGQCRSTARQLPSLEPESTTIPSTRWHSVLRARASRVAGRQPAPLWFTSTTDSSGPLSMPPYIAHVPARRSVLLVTQHSPPTQLSGARRPANLTNYLARRGHRVAVLTSLASGSGDLSGAQHLVRTRDVLSSRLNWRRESWESMRGSAQASASQASVLERVVVPDLALVGWIPFALPRAFSLARQESFDCVVTTSPPQSAHLIGWMLRRRGTPWVADLRDGWTFDPPRPPWPTRAQEVADRALERAALSRADRLVAVTEPIARDLRDRLARDVAVITNGFDPEEYEGEAQL